MKKILPIFTACCIVLIAAGLVRAHCQIPCGIYDDQMRVHMIAEHIKTIEKSMNEIMRLEKEGPKNYNQLVRWIMNKDDHADQLEEIITKYFMAQRIKIDQDQYKEQLVLLHKMLVYTMKCKQTVALENVETLRSLLKDFSELYFEDYHSATTKSK